MIPYWNTYSYPMVYYPTSYYPSPYPLYNVTMNNNYIPHLIPNFNMSEPHSLPIAINCENSEAVNAT